MVLHVHVLLVVTMMMYVGDGNDDDDNGAVADIVSLWLCPSSCCVITVPCPMMLITNVCGGDYDTTDVKDGCQ